MKNAARKSGRELGIAGSYPGALRATIAAALLFLLGGGAVPAGSAGLAERVRAALDAGRDVAGTAAHTSVGRLEMGGEVVGRVETRAVRHPRALREAMDIAGVRQTVTLIGDEAWIEDANGSVRALEGEELVSARTAHDLIFHTYLEPGAARADEAAPAFHLEPAGAAPRVLEIGADALPLRFRQSVSGTATVTEFSDWRAVDGVLWPFVSRQDTGDPRFVLTVRTTEAAYPATLPDGAIPRPAVRIAEDFTFTDAEAAARIPVEFAGSLVLVPVRVNGTGASFLLDTGAGATVIAAAFAERVGLVPRGRMEARGAGGSEAATFVDVPLLELPGVELRDQTVVAVPLDAVAGALGRDIDGILGYDFLSRFAVEIDYAAAHLGVRPSGTYVPRAGSLAVPLRIEANVPRVLARLDDRPEGWFLFDTGNNWPLLLHAPFVREHGLAAEGHGTLGVAGVGGQETMHRSTSDSLVIGRRVFRRVETLLATAEAGALALDDSIGNIGGGLFADSWSAFDYGAGTLWMAASVDSASTR